MRIAGHGLHMVDRLAHVDGGEKLWKATEQDAADIGPPLSRILNRYDATRRLAGHVDEAELTFALGSYVKRNLILRGQLVRREKARAQQAEQAHGGAEAFEHMTHGTTAETAPSFQVPDPPPVADALFDEDEDPAQPAAFAFDPWAPQP